MTYASANRRPNPAAMMGALGIPGAIGALLVVGLAVTVTVVPRTPNPRGEEIPTVPLPPPPPPTPDKPRVDNKTTKPTALDGPIITLPPVIETDGPIIEVGPWIDTIPGTGGGTGSGEIGIPAPTPTALPFKPMGAAARGNPGNWVTDGDYRPRWIRENMTGSARFTLNIDANGRVSNCTITRSTGHAELDAATCQLVTKRARFDAARDGNGKPVAGSYSNSVNWNIPE
jgi:periplasmic protein TonB